MQHGKRRDVKRHGYAAWPEVFEMAKSKSNVWEGRLEYDGMLESRYAMG